MRRLLIGSIAFRLGLAIRLTLIIAAAPQIQQNWFLPFLTTLPKLGPLPWSGFLAAGGDPAAFPYGLPYFAAFGPGVWLGDWLAGDIGARVGLGLGILSCELALLSALCAIFGKAISDRVIMLYWLSPISIYVGYWHGQLDFLPVALLIASLWAIKNSSLVRSGVLYGIAIAAKLSMVLPAVFMGLYFFGRPRLRRIAIVPALSAILIPLALIAPFAISDGFRRMVLLTPEASKIFALKFSIAAGIDIYILPMVYLVLMYAAWRIRRLDFQMLWTFTGLGMLSFLLLTPASPGWAVWALPFLALHAARSDLRTQGLYWIFCSAFVGLHLLISTGAVALGRYDLSRPFGDELGMAVQTRAASVLLTIILASGLALAAQMVRAGVLTAPFRLATQRPIAIGIGGDSGAGKDTMVDAIVGVFGDRNVARLSGDDYHLWDRHKPMWRAITHLNPKANELDAFEANLAALLEGRSVRARHYDHSNGRLSKPVEIQPAEIVAASGLHALWSPSLAKMYDVRVFLDMDEDLRRFLKTQRDVRHRGYSPHKVAKSIANRWADSLQFIRPQAGQADVVMRLEPRHHSAIADLEVEIPESRLRLVVTTGPGGGFDQLSRLLTSLCGMKVFELPLPSGSMEIVIEGEPTGDDIAAAVRRLAPEMDELLDLQPVWRSGLQGVMQLIVVDQIQKASRRRSLAR